MLYIDTVLQYYLNINPDSLDDDVWACKFKILEDIRKKEAEANK